MAIQKERTVKEIKFLADKVNKRLSAIEKLTGRKESWAVKELYRQLESKQGIPLTSSGNISKDLKNLSDEQLVAELKALRNFMKSKTSTIRGIKEVRRKQIETMTKVVDDSRFNAGDFTYDDAEKLHEIWGDKRNRWFAEKMGGSEYYQFIQEFKDTTMKSIEVDDENYKTEGAKRQAQKQAFIDELNDYINVANDPVQRRKAVEVFNKYVNPKRKK